MAKYRVAVYTDVDLPAHDTHEYQQLRAAFLAVDPEWLVDEETIDEEIAGWLATGTDHDYDHLVEVIEASVEELS